MSFTLDDKSPDYIDTLQKVATKYKDTEPLLVKIFCKYADPHHGSIVSRRGIFTLLSEEEPGLIIQDDQPHLLLNPNTLREAPHKNLEDIEWTRLPRDKIKYKLEKFDKILYVKAKEWHTSINEVRAIWILSKNIWLRSIDLRYPGYTYDELKIQKGWKDVFIAER